jgi:hypothetical protein
MPRIAERSVGRLLFHKTRLEKQGATATWLLLLIALCTPNKTCTDHGKHDSNSCDS